MNAIVKGSNLGLDGIGDLSDLLKPKTDNTVKGEPIEIPLHLIVEDPDQPRKKFNEERLKQMTESIIERGVISPISVRNHPEKEGYYLINYGAYRYRGSWRAGKEAIPALVNNSYADPDKNTDLRFDQVIENLHRDELLPMDIALFIKEQMDSGLRQAEIARRLNRSKTFVTTHLSLIDMPLCIDEAFSSERFSDVSLVMALRNLYQDHEESVTEFLSDPTTVITRGTVKKLREFIEETNDHDNFHSGEQEQRSEEDNVGNSGKKSTKKKKENDPEKMKKGIVLVSIDDRSGRIILDRRPSGEGFGWVRFDLDGQEDEIDLRQLTVIGIIEG